MIHGRMKFRIHTTYERDDQGFPVKRFYFNGPVADELNKTRNDRPLDTKEKVDKQPNKE